VPTLAGRPRQRIARRLLSDGLTARRAAWIIGVFTLLVTILAALLAYLLDRQDFPNLGISAWWAVQTVTTVGYGDFVPSNTEGRLIGGVVMVVGIGFLTVVTASIAAAFVENARRRLGDETEPAGLDEKLDEVLARLERLEAATQPSPGGASGERESDRGSGHEP
jgi:voltage-gated potassium channel